MATHRAKALAVDCLSGGGEMGMLMRELDWSATPVGPVAGWPQSLKVAIGILLGSRYPMFVWWGRRMTMFHNDAYAPILGKRHPDALGKSGPVVWAEIWEDIRPLMEPVLDEGRACWAEERLLLMERNGYLEEAYFTFSYSPIPDDQGGVGGIFCACSEDTGRVLGQRRQRTLREMAARTAEARTTEDACVNVSEVLAGNRHDLPFTLLFLLDAEGFTARLAGSTGLGDDSPARLSTVDVGGGAEGVVPWPFSGVMRSGRAEPVVGLSGRLGHLPGNVWPETPDSALVLPVKHPGQDRLAGFLVAGLNTRRSLDDDYRGFLDLLAGQIATALANARAYEEERRRAESLAELDRAKTAFFSNVSHEFRTPLTLMLGPVEDILARPDRVHPEDRESLGLVLRNALRLQKLVNTLLDFSRIEAGRVKAAYEPIDLPALTSELASNFRSACEKAGLDLVVDCPPLPEPVYVDRDMWEKVVLNLLSNAFKFTHRGRIGVRLRPAGRHVELAVQDTGTGIPPEELLRLFERFHRIEGAGGRTQEGTGIGLALVRELAHLHGGEVRAESEHGVGSVFLVTIPLGTAHLPADRLVPSRTPASTFLGAAPFVEEALRWLPGVPTTDAPADDRRPFARPEWGPSGASPGSPQMGPRPALLLADDNADMREYARRLLADRYEVTAVADGLSALAAAREHPPDLVLTDVMMPGLDGFGLLRELRADARTRDVPVLLLSARAGEEARVEGLEAGADEYITKPFNARVLLASVRAHLELAGMRREAAESLRRGEERLVAALAASDTGTFRWDPETGGFLDFDDSLKRLFGFTADEPVRAAEDFLARVHPDDRPQVVQAVDRCRRGADFEMEFRVTLPDGSVRWLFDRGKMMRDDGGCPTYLVGACTDITNRKLIEEALKDADRRKDEFLATLAHELRNPLAPIRNALHLMRRPDDDEMEPERAMAERQVTHLARLIDDLMDVARISRGQIELHMEIVDLATVVRQAVQTARPQIAERRHLLTVSLPEGQIRLEADPTRLEQVLWNLLNNSAKYTGPGGQIRMSAERDGGEVVVRVRDTGIGMRSEMLPKVFDMFVQVGEHRDHAQGGLGIGLSLVRTLVEMHGGSITAHSEGPGTGSEFIVRLPILAESRMERASEEDGRGGSGGGPPRRRILVVDDNMDAARSLARLLARLYGQEVRVAHDGPEALTVADEFRPEVVLLDIGLPGMDGNEVARRLRERPEFETTLIVALTGWGQESDVERSRAAGFDHHLVKPADPEAILGLLTNRVGGTTNSEPDPR